MTNQKTTIDWDKCEVVSTDQLEEALIGDDPQQAADEAAQLIAEHRQAEQHNRSLGLADELLGAEKIDPLAVMEPVDCDELGTLQAEQMAIRTELEQRQSAVAAEEQRLEKLLDEDPDAYFAEEAAREDAETARLESEQEAELQRDLDESDRLTDEVDEELTALASGATPEEIASVQANADYAFDSEFGVTETPGM